MARKVAVSWRGMTYYSKVFKITKYVSFEFSRQKWCLYIFANFSNIWIFVPKMAKTLLDLGRKMILLKSTFQTPCVWCVLQKIFSFRRPNVLWSWRSLTLYQSEFRSSNNLVTFLFALTFLLWLFTPRCQENKWSGCWPLGITKIRKEKFSVLKMMMYFLYLYSCTAILGTVIVTWRTSGIGLYFVASIRIRPRVRNQNDWPTNFGKTSIQRISLASLTSKCLNPSFFHNREPMSLSPVSS